MEDKRKALSPVHINRQLDNLEYVNNPGLNAVVDTNMQLGNRLPVKMVN